MKTAFNCSAGVDGKDKWLKLLNSLGDASNLDLLLDYVLDDVLDQWSF